MIDRPKQNPGTLPLLARLNALADSRSRSPFSLVAVGAVATVILAILFMSGTFTAIALIDEAAVEAERQRGAIAIELLSSRHTTLSSDTLVARLAHEHGLGGARVTLPDMVDPAETSLPLPGTTAVVAWTPRRYATEAYESLRPVRLIAGTLTVFCIAFILLRLHGVARDLETRRLLAQELAARDALTGLKNRLTFDHELRSAFAKGGEAERGLALLYLDLDAFKPVNDTRGHTAGDQLLRMIGERLTAVVTSADTVARIGGDEFAIVRREDIDRAALVALAARVRTVLATPFPIDGSLVTIGVSIGIATAPDVAKTAEDLVRAADLALYRAKAGGAPGYAFADADEPDRRDRTPLAAATA